MARCLFPNLAYMRAKERKRDAGSGWDTVSVVDKTEETHRSPFSAAPWLWRRQAGRPAFWGCLKLRHKAQGREGHKSGEHSSAWHTACTQRGITQPVAECWSASTSTRQKGVLAINQGALKDAWQLWLLRFLLCYRPYKSIHVEATHVKPPCPISESATGRKEVRVFLVGGHMWRIGTLKFQSHQAITSIRFFFQCPTSTILWTATCSTSAEWISADGGGWWSCSLRSLAWCQKAMTAPFACASRTMTTENTPVFSQVTHQLYCCL